MTAMRIAGNEYSLREAAGAFGDLGTLIPFIVGYITVAKIDPSGVLVAFGVFKIIAGLTYRTPVPIQPMKAIGTAAISSAGAITPAAVWASGLFTGVLWLIMGLSGAVSWIAKITSRPVIHGLVLGLGLGFLLEGIKLAQDELILTVAAVAVTFVLLSYERIPATLVVSAFLRSRWARSAGKTWSPAFSSSACRRPRSRSATRSWRPSRRIIISFLTGQLLCGASRLITG
jgi:Molybdate transporter of MFS superfamily